MCLHVSRVFGCSFSGLGLFDGLGLFFVPFQSRAREKKIICGVYGRCGLYGLNGPNGLNGLNGPYGVYGRRRGAQITICVRFILSDLL